MPEKYLEIECYFTCFVQGRSLEGLSHWFAYWFFLVQWEIFLTVVRYFWQIFQELVIMLWNCYLCFCPDQRKNNWNAGQTMWICQKKISKKFWQMTSPGFVLEGPSKVWRIPAGRTWKKILRKIIEPVIERNFYKIKIQWRIWLVNYLCVVSVAGLLWRPIHDSHYIIIGFINLKAYSNIRFLFFLNSIVYILFFGRTVERGLKLETRREY